ncbi:MAG: type IV pilin protein [Thermodesulfobacteriota bacterium]
MIPVKRTSVVPGFSLVELMIVLAIIGILSAVAVPAYMNHLYRSRQNDAVQILMDIQRTQEMFHALNDAYAPSIGALGAFTDTHFDTAHYAFAVTVASTDSFLVTATGDPNGDGTAGDNWSIDEDDRQPTHEPSSEALTFSLIDQIL